VKKKSPQIKFRKDWKKKKGKTFTKKLCFLEREFNERRGQKREKRGVLSKRKLEEKNQLRQEKGMRLKNRVNTP